MCSVLCDMLQPHLEHCRHDFPLGSNPLWKKHHKQRNINKLVGWLIEWYHISNDGLSCLSVIFNYWIEKNDVTLRHEIYIELPFWCLFMSPPMASVENNDIRILIFGSRSRYYIKSECFRLTAICIRHFPLLYQEMRLEELHCAIVILKKTT